MIIYVSPGGRELLFSKAEFLRRAWVPYGKWTCADGREILFNRFYEPIWQRQDGVNNKADAKEWVKFSKQTWFYNDGTSEKQIVSTGTEALAAWGLPTKMPKIVETGISEATYRSSAKRYRTLDSRDPREEPTIETVQTERASKTQLPSRNWSLISLSDHFAIGAMWRQMHDNILLIGRVVGPAYGAAMCNQTLHVERSLFSLRIGLMDTCWDQYGRASDSTQPYDEIQRDLRPQNNERAFIRQKATNIIEPVIPYEDPKHHVTRRNGRLTGPLTFREHLVIGDILGQMKEYLTFLFVEKLQFAYGKTHKTVMRVQSSLKRIDALRSALDSKVCAEYPLDVRLVEGIKITSAYYNWRRHLSNAKALEASPPHSAH